MSGFPNYQILMTRLMAASHFNGVALLSNTKNIWSAAKDRLTKDEIKRYARKMYEEPATVKAQFYSIFSETMNRVGVACLSEINNSILLWSHYANCRKECLCQV